MVNITRHVVIKKHGQADIHMTDRIPKNVSTTLTAINMMNWISLDLLQQVGMKVTTLENVLKLRIPYYRYLNKTAQ